MKILENSISWYRVHLKKHMTTQKLSVKTDIGATRFVNITFWLKFPFGRCVLSERCRCHGMLKRLTK